MKVISSRDNSLYKELKLLASNSQARRKANRTLLDGVHLCEAYLLHVGAPAICIVSDASVGLAEVSPIVDRCEQARVPCITMSDALFAALSQVEHGVGLLFVVDTPRLGAPEKLTESTVLLDNLQDPGNLGSILRSSAAAGLRQIYCGKGTAFAWSPKVLRAGMGAHFLLSIFEGVDLEQLIIDSGIPIIATSSHAPAHIYDVDLRKPVAWLFGHEGQGVSRNLLERATKQVSIPHLGSVESLNVAASAAVCLFEQVRQKNAAPRGS